MTTSSLLRKIVRSQILPLSLFVLLFHLICMGSVSMGTEVEIDCDQLLSKEGLNNIGSERIMEIQKILEQCGYYTSGIDGKAGPETRSALEKYCADSKVKYEGGLVYTLTEKDLEELKETEVPDTIQEKLKILQDVAYPYLNLFQQALNEYKVLVGADNYDSLILEKARKVHPFSDYQDMEINWTGGACGCVLEDLSGVVYGFYPFWLADEKQMLDFSVLSRIGYYALSLDEHGNIVEPLSWDKDRATFINMARDHRTKVDLVVHVDKWSMWRELDTSAFHELTDNIAGLITRKLPNRLLNRIKPFITFGRASVPAIGDGITLYFEGTEEGDGSARHSFVSFIRELREKLKTAGNDYNLNLLLPMNILLLKDEDGKGKGLFGYENLGRLIPDKQEGEEGYEKKNYVDYFLVFIHEPTTDTKKKLRQKIENNFKGVQRKTMLRKVIPVITPAIPTTDVEEHIQKVEQQLKDDLIYFVDNFGGVGIWPLPFKITPDGEADASPVITPTGTQVINSALKEGTDPVTDICKFVCPKRWYFRIAWDMLLAVLAIFCLCYFISCKVRYISHSYRTYSGLVLGALLLLTILLHVVLLECDPHRSFEFTDPVTIIGGIVYAAAVFIIVQLFGRKGEQP